MGQACIVSMLVFDAGSCAKNPAISAISKTEFPLLESGLRTVRSIFVKVRWGYTPTVLFLLFHCVFASFCASAFAVDFAWAHCVALFWQADLAFETT